MGAGTLLIEQTGNVFSGQGGNPAVYVGTLFGSVSNGSVSVEALQLTTTPTSGYVLTSDAEGNATWQASSGGSSSATYFDGIVDGVGTDTGAYATIEDAVTAGARRIGVTASVTLATGVTAAISCLSITVSCGISVSVTANPAFSNVTELYLQGPGSWNGAGGITFIDTTVQRVNIEDCVFSGAGVFDITPTQELWMHNVRMTNMDGSTISVGSGGNGTLETVDIYATTLILTNVGRLINCNLSGGSVDHTMGSIAIISGCSLNVYNMVGTPPSSMVIQGNEFSGLVTLDTTSGSLVQANINGNAFSGLTVSGANNMNLCNISNNVCGNTFTVAVAVYTSSIVGNVLSLGEMDFTSAVTIIERTDICNNTILAGNININSAGNIENSRISGNLFDAGGLSFTDVGGVRVCSITDNMCNSAVTGIEFVDTGGGGRIDDTTITGNSCDAAILFDDMICEKVTVSGNRVIGITWTTTGAQTMSGCAVSGNSTPAIPISFNNYTLTNNTIVGNTAHSITLTGGGETFTAVSSNALVDVAGLSGFTIVGPPGTQITGNTR